MLLEVWPRLRLSGRVLQILPLLLLVIRTRLLLRSLIGPGLLILEAMRCRLIAGRAAMEVRAFLTEA